MDCFSFIYQRSNQQLVLTVTTPPLGNDPFSLDYTPAQGFEGAAVIVAHRKACANGNSMQLWRYDPITGFIEAFAADTTNIGIHKLTTLQGLKDRCLYVWVRVITFMRYAKLPSTRRRHQNIR